MSAVHRGMALFHYRARLRVVLRLQPRAHRQVEHGVEPATIHARIEPDPHHREDRLQHARIGELRVVLVTVLALPLVRFNNLFRGSVGDCGIKDENACLGVSIVNVRPYIAVPLRRSEPGRPRAATTDAGPR
jgi:hypothetical protein